MTTFRFGVFVFDRRSGELRRDGDPVKLAPQPARLLACLLGRAGEVVLRDELRREIWGDDTFVDVERSLNFCVQQVRAALGDSSDNPRFIQTVPRRGYRFIAPVSATPTPGPDLPDATAPVASAPPPPAPALPVDPPQASPALPDERRLDDLRAPRRWWLAVAAMLIVAPAVWLLLGTRGPSTSARASALTDSMRLVILPFVNLTGDPAADYLADGLTDELIARLGELGGNRFNVIARTSSMAYRGTAKTVAAIGADLRVGYVVEGSVRREGETLRISTSLVAVRDQTALAAWDESFEDRAFEARQTYAAIRLARLIAGRLTPSPPAASPQTTPQTAAWDALLQASSSLEKGTPDEVRRAIAHLERAVQHDPDFAAGWAQLAQARHVLVMMGVEPAVQAYEAVRNAADRAVSLDPTLAAAHVARGLASLWYEWQTADAARSFERGLALNPSDAAAHHDYAWTLAALGRDSEAVRHISIARDLDPLSTRANNDVGWLHLQLRQPAEAARACQQTLALDANALEAQACLERAFVERRLFDAALRAARAATPQASAAVPTTSREPQAALHELWRWRLDRLERMARSRWVSPYTLAVQYALVGDREHALDKLEAALGERAATMVLLARDPAFDTLRGDPRFQSILNRIGPPG